MPLTQNVKFAPLAITLATEILKRQPQEKSMEILPMLFPVLMEVNPNCEH